MTDTSLPWLCLRLLHRFVSEPDKWYQLNKNWIIIQGVNNRWNRWSENQSINRWQSMPCYLIGIDWHRPIDYQSIITQKWSQLIDCHRLALKNLSVPHVPTCTYTHSYYAQMFAIWIRSPQCLYAVVWFQKSTTETHFKTVFWRNTSQNHTFSLSCSSLSFMLLMSGSYELEL